MRVASNTALEIDERSNERARRALSLFRRQWTPWFPGELVTYYYDGRVCAKYRATIFGVSAFFWFDSYFTLLEVIELNSPITGYI